MSLATIDAPESIDVPFPGEVWLDTQTADADLLKRMNQAALEMAAAEFEDGARAAIDLPAQDEDERDMNALKAAHLMLAALLTRRGIL